ncbi:MAG: HEAT repeat domain-containing protein, partial [Synechococcus sp.]
DRDRTVRFRASQALGSLGTASDTVIQGLVKCLQDEDPTVRFRASQALGSLGTASDTVIQGLLECLKDDLVCTFAAAALVSCGKQKPGTLQDRLSEWIESNQKNTFVHYGVDTLLELVTEVNRIG